MFEECGDAELLDIMSGEQRAERTAIARRMIAAGRFGLRRLALAGDEHCDWCVDDWEAIAAEVAAELGISRGLASSQMHYCITLIERLPKLGAVFEAGAVDFRVIAVAVYRTGFITDKDVLAEIDAVLAEKAPLWNKLSREKVAQLVDWMVIERDPEAVRASSAARRRPPYRGGTRPVRVGRGLRQCARTRCGGVRQEAERTRRLGVP